MPTNEYGLPVNLNPPPTLADTQLFISAWGQLIYQARGLTQTYKFIEGALQIDRDAYGNAIDLSNPAFHKYRTTITCTDVRPPPLDAAFPGIVYTVTCAAFMCFPVGNPGSPARTVASGSDFTENGFTFYLPVLTMMVFDASWFREEWKANQGWSLTMEEA